jgi:hypothetical protein
MSTELDEALEWFGRAEQAREVAGQLTDLGAKQAVLRLADSFDRLGQAALDPIAFVIPGVAEVPKPFLSGDV